MVPIIYLVPCYHPGCRRGAWQRARQPDFFRVREADRRAGPPQRDGDRRRERAEAGREDQATQAAGTWCDVAIF